jgi:SAM-dependent methyltransferase
MSSTTTPSEGGPFEASELAEDGDRLALAELSASFAWAATVVADRHVLVIGCGHGHGARTLHEAGAASVVGVDPDPRAIEVAMRLYGERISFVRAEPLAVPLATGSFDVVVCIDVPEVLADPEGAIAELRRVLGSDGLLLASMPLGQEHGDAAGELPPISSAEQAWRRGLEGAFAKVRPFRRRLSIASVVMPADAGPQTRLDRAHALAADPGEDRSLLVAASDGELPDLPPAAGTVSARDLRAHREALGAWEERARRAEADGSAKHWELVAAREAQRRLRKRLHELEHRPLRKLLRVLRGRPARIGAGPPIRASEHKPERWD